MRHAPLRIRPSPYAGARKMVRGLREAMTEDERYAVADHVVTQPQEVRELFIDQHGLVPIIEEGTKRVASRCDEDHRFWIFDWAAGPPQALIRSCWDCLRTGRQNVMAVKVELGAPRRYSSKTIKQGSVSCSASLAFSIASVRRHPLPSRWYSVSFRIKRAAQGRI